MKHLYEIFDVWIINTSSDNLNNIKIYNIIVTLTAFNGLCKLKKVIVMIKNVYKACSLFITIFTLNYGRISNQNQCVNKMP